MRVVPDWWIQTTWWASGIFATGAVWYFLSTRDYPLAGVAGALAVGLAVVAILLHKAKDRAARAVAPAAADSMADEFSRRYTDQPSHVRFLKALPKLRAVVYEAAQEGWDTGVTADMRQASYDVIDFLEYAWTRLAEFYPARHFGDKDSREYIRGYIRDRFRFHWAKHEPDGPGTGGTIVGVLTGGDVIADLESLVADTVGTLFAHRDDFDLEAWLAAWKGGSAADQATP